jgi:hypothetical protein
MDNSFNIVALIETNPISRLSNEYNNKFLTKIKDKFNELEQQMFVSSFYCYLNYHPTNDYVIDLDNIWKWLGFSQKGMAKRTLEKYFTIEKDYKCSLCRPAKQKEDGRGGHNKETILLNINTFKLFCIKTETKKANEIHEYFIKLESILQEIVQEESNELKQQLEQIKTNNKSTLEKEKVLQREQLLLREFASSGSLVYIIKVKTFEDGKYLLKIGQSIRGVKARYDEHKKNYPECLLLDCFSVLKSGDFERFIHSNEKIRDFRYNELEGHEKEIELFLVGGGLSYDMILRIIKDNLKTFNEYTRADFEVLELKIEKLEYENQQLKQALKEQKLYVEHTPITPIQEQYNPQNIILQQMQKQINEITEKITPSSQTKITTGFNEIKQTVGPRLLEINPETLQINKIYETVNEALKESNFKLKRPSIQKAITENTIYNGFRWLYADRNENPEETIKSLKQTRQVKPQVVGYIAKLNQEKTEIINVYLDRKTASLQNGYESASGLDAPVKNDTAARGYYYVLYEKCPDELREQFVQKNNGREPLLYKEGVGQYDANQNLLQEFICKYDCIKSLQMSDKTLAKTLDKNVLYNNHYYKKLGSKLSCM